MKNRSQRYEINRTRPRHGHKYTKYKFCLGTMMAICIKQHLSNIQSSSHEKFKLTKTELKKSAAYKKSVYTNIQNTACLGKMRLNSFKGWAALRLSSTNALLIKEHEIYCQFNETGMVLFDIFSDNIFYKSASYIRWQLKKVPFANFIPS